MTNSSEGVYKRSVRAGSWVLISNLVQKGLSIVSFLILARLLTPQDYGIMAVIFMMTGFFDTFTSAGLEKALMQRQHEDDKYLNTIWTFNFLKSTVLFFVVLGVAPYIASFFHQVEATTIIRYGAIFVLIPSLANSRQFYFFKNLEFKKVFYRDLTAQVAYIVAALFYVFLVEASVWALFAGHLARYVISTTMTYVLYPYWQRFSFKFKRLKDLFGYGKWITGQNILTYLLGAIDSIYVGRLIDLQRLGYYTKARDLSYTFISPLFNIINAVGFPAYAKVKNELSKIQEGFLHSFNIVIALTIPFFLVLLAEGGLIVNLLLGPNWLGIVGPLKILAATTVFSSLVSILKPIFDATGRPDINVKANVIQLVFFIVLVYFGAKLGGLNGVAFAVLTSWAAILLYVIFAARKLLHLGWDKFRGSVYSVAAALLVVLLTAAPFYLLQLLDLWSMPITVLFIAVLGLFYLYLLWFFGKKYEHSPRATLLSIWSQIRKSD